MTAVPRLFEAIRSKILKGLEKQSTTKQKMFSMAVDLGRKRHQSPSNLSFGEKLKDFLAEKSVRTKIRKRFGGRLKALVSGGAALNYEVGLFFEALGVKIIQGYGQTEAAPIISVNKFHKSKLGSVGPPMVGVDLKIANDGEILVKGDLLMQGYWNNDKATKETIIDGWLHTGDIGQLDDEGFLTITDRKKDIIVTAGGDNVSPARVEGFLTLNTEIAQAMIYGDKKPYLVALIVPDPKFLAEWRQQNNKPGDMTALAEDPDLIKVIQAAVTETNKPLSNLEKVRKFILAEEEFTTENEMLTPSMKIRRHIIKEKYANALETLYDRKRD